MNGATLARAMGQILPQSRYDALVAGANDAMRRAQVTNVNRAAMWCAQIGHESVGLKYTEEIHDGSNYEGRHDLGNVQPGDGKRFKGRSFIQITGRHNYTMLSAWAHAKGLVPDPRYFVDHPFQLGSDRYAWLGAVWYWTVARPNLNALADQRNIRQATIAINGGLNGLPDREFRWRRCLGLGDTILPHGKDELIGMDANDVERMIVNAMRAYHKGGDRGRFTRKKYGGWVKPANRGMGDRVYTLEQKQKGKST